MRVNDWLKQATAELKKVGIGTAQLDSLILLEDELGKDRAWILANPQFELSQTHIKRVDRRVARRARHIPIAYIRGHTEFYGRKFRINRHVLEPRPESETMVEHLTQLPMARKLVIADVGTGCGAIGITAALELKNKNVDLYDISSSALGVAKHNTHLHELHLHARKMNLLARPIRPYDVILANLPYVPANWKINEAAMAEPKIAIFGGKDGLDIYRKMFDQLQRFTWKPKYVLCESLPPQHPKLELIAMDHGFKLYKSEDFIQVFRNKD